MIRKQINSNLLFKTHKRPFLIKYLLKKRIVDRVDESSASQTDKQVKINAIDLKELLDEKKITLTFWDIRYDYRCFKDSYLYNSPLDYEWEITRGYTKIQESNFFGFYRRKVKLPFDEKTISFKKFYRYYVFDKESNPSMRDNYIVFIFLYVCIIYGYFKFRSIQKANKTYADKYLDNSIKSDYSTLDNFKKNI